MFYPLAMDTWGGFDTGASSRLLSEWAEILSARECITITEADERIRLHIQVAAMGQMATNGEIALARLRTVEQAYQMRNQGHQMQAGDGQA